MHADYIANPLYDNNPFIEALPPMLSGKDLIHALAVIPPYNDSDRDRSTGERLQLLSSLYEFYQPLCINYRSHSYPFPTLSFGGRGGTAAGTERNGSEITERHRDLSSNHHGQH